MYEGQGLRAQLKHRIYLAASAYWSQELMINQDESLSFTGKDCLAIFKQVQAELERQTVTGAKIGICSRDACLQALLTLATLYSQRVPVVLNHNKFEDAHEVHARIGFSLILEQSGLDWHTPPSVGSLIFDKRAQFIGRRPRMRANHAGAAYANCGLILLTSGTTGNQKAVNIPILGMMETYCWLANRFSLTAQDVSTILLPLSHTFALNTHFLPSFLAGTKCVFLNHSSQLGRQYELIGRSRGTFVAVLGELLRLLKREKNLRRLPVCDHVRHLQMAGGKITEEHLTNARELFPNAVLHKGYGMTETIRTTMIDSRDQKFLSDTCGLPLPGVEIEIRDDKGQRLSPGQFGEIYIRSRAGLLAYDNSEIGSAAGEDGFFRTRDWGLLDAQGYLTCVDRVDRVFKIAGRKVSALELENAIADLDHVEAAKVAPINDSRKGTRPVMFIEFNSGDEEKENPGSGLIQLENSLRERLEPSKVPRDIVLMAKLPRTANAKVKIDVLQRLWETQRNLAPLSYGTGFIRFYKLMDSYAKGETYENVRLENNDVVDAGTNRGIGMGYQR